MLYNKLIAIGVSSHEIQSVAELEEENDKNNIVYWIIALVLVIALCIFVAFVLPKLKVKLKKRRIKSKELKQAKVRDAELERLHKIKRQNKRK